MVQAVEHHRQMGIYRRILHHDVVGGLDAVGGKIPDGTHPAGYHVVTGLLCPVDRHGENADAGIELALQTGEVGDIVHGYAVDARTDNRTVDIESRNNVHAILCQSCILQQRRTQTSHSEDDRLVLLAETQKLFQKAILQLPEKQRIIFNLKYFQEMKYEEISEILGTSVGALKASYHHAVKKIEEFFEKHD